MKRTSKIENFLDGTMKGKERADFEKQIAKDKELAEEVVLHKDVNDAILEDDVHYFRMNVMRIMRANKKGSTQLQTRVTRFIKYPVAATILLLIGFSLWQIIVNKSPHEIYTMFYSPYQTDISTRSVERMADKVQISYLLYQEGDYEASFEILKNYLSENFNNQTAHFYFGMNALELGQYELAIKELKSVAEDHTTPFSIHAQWYLAMTYLKIDQKEESTLYLIELTNTENYYSEKAERVLKKL